LKAIRVLEPFLLSGNLSRLLHEIPIHHGPAASAQADPMLHHARRYAINVRNFRAAEAKRVPGAHLLRLGAERIARRRQGEEGHKRNYQPGVSKCLDHGPSPLLIPDS
jgi:hypothetical protein